MNSQNNFYSANEIKLDEIGFEYQPCNMYVIVVMYHINKQHTQFVRINGTDFTETNCFRPVAALTDHCKLNGERILDQKQIMLVEQSIRVFQSFTDKYGLEPASFDPNRSVYEKKLIIEVRGFIKRYRNIVNFQKADLKILTKQDVINKVKIQKDHHLTGLIQRLVINCPKHWIIDLNRLYGLNELLDDINFYQSQNQYGFRSQGAKQVRDADTNNIPKFKLLTDPPTKIVNNTVSPSDYVKELITNVKLEERSDLTGNCNFKMDQIQIEKEKKKEDSRLKYLSCAKISVEEASINQQEFFSQSVAYTTAEMNDNRNSFDNVSQNNNYKIGISSLPIATQIQRTVDDSEIDGCFRDVYIHGFSPKVDQQYLLRNEKTNEIEITDSFEIYFKFSQFDTEIYTLGFKSAKDVMKTLFNSSEIKLTESLEAGLKKKILEIFCRGKVFRIPSALYLLYQKGEDHIQTSGF